MGKTKPINSEGKPIIEKAFWTEITIIQQWDDNIRNFTMESLILAQDER